MTDPAQLESFRYLLTQGVLGLACFIEGLVVWKLYRDKESLGERCSKVLEEKSELTRDVANAVSRISVAMEERNRVMDSVASAISEVATGFKGLGVLLAAQHERVIDRFKDRERP